MKYAAIALLASVLSAGLVTLLTDSSEQIEPQGKSIRDLEQRLDEVASDTSVAESLSDLKQELSSLERKLETQQKDFEDRLAAAATLVARAETQKGGKGSGGGESDGVSNLSPAEAKAEFVEDAVDRLLDPELRGSERQALWNKAVERGALGDLIAAFEARAKENPNDPDAQSDMGDAYIQKIFTVEGPAKGLWSMKANAAYDKALAVDETHWKSRFSKAVNYSFNPPVLGLQPKAIEQFEILRKQQEAGDPQPHFAETYLYLGNLYANQGKDDKAQEVYQRGLEIHPDSGSLKGKVKSQ
ncbi:MAG: tetratricopeptide repeat protein [Planctomycetota bacterium]